MTGRLLATDRFAFGQDGVAGTIATFVSDGSRLDRLIFDNPPRLRLPNYSAKRTHWNPLAQWLSITVQFDLISQDRP